MTSLKNKLIASGIVSLVTILVASGLTSGVVEARLAANHNDTVLVRR